MDAAALPLHCVSFTWSARVEPTATVEHPQLGRVPAGVAGLRPWSVPRLLPVSLDRTGYRAPDGRVHLAGTFWLRQWGLSVAWSRPAVRWVAWIGTLLSAPEKVGGGERVRARVPLVAEC